MSDLLFNADGAPAPGPTGPDPVSDGSSQTFMTDVIEASKTVPVLVDFWATWCGPCKTLTPILEKRVRELNGAVKLVKIDIDQNQDIAGQLRVQSVPTVYAFKDGQPVDGFQGALPDSQIKAFLDKLTGGAGSPLDEALGQAKEALETGNLKMAKQIFAQVLQHDPSNAPAIGGMLKVMIAEGEVADARTTVDRLPDEIKSDPDVASAIAALELAEQSGGAGDDELAQLRAAMEANPKDHQARYDFALAATGLGQHEAALDALLDIIAKDRGWNDDAARLQLLKMFEALGNAHPLTQEGRRRLSSVLFS